MLFLFHQLFVKHLLKIQRFLAENSILYYKKPSDRHILKLDRIPDDHDDLDLLVDAINTMCVDVGEHLEMRKQAEQKLMNLNTNMESEVKARINEAKAHQVNMKTSARLSSLGEMAGNIAHEINNPPTTISGFLGVLKYYLNSPSMDPHRISHICDCIESTVKLIQNIIQGLLRLSRHNPADGLEPQKVIPIVYD